MFKYTADRIRVPLKPGQVNLFVLLGKLVEDFDPTDSIESVKLHGVSTVDGVDIACQFTSPLKQGRDLLIDGALGSIANAPFALLVNPETATATVSVTLPENFGMELFAELEVQRVNYNRRSA